MSQTDGFEKGLIAVLDTQEIGLDEVDKYGPAIIRVAVSHYLSLIAVVPGATDKVADILIARLHSAVAYGRKAIAVEKRMVQELGSPDRLRAMASQIGSGITTPADSLSKQVIKDNLKAIGSHNWVADASDAYTNGFDGQTAAVALVSTTAKGIEDALNGLADGLDAAFSSLEQAAASYAAVIAGLIGALATIETIVGGIIGLVVAVVGLIGVGVNIVTLLVSIGDNTGDDLRELATNSLKWHEPNFATS